MLSVRWLYVWCQLFLFQRSDVEQLFTFESKTIDYELGMDEYVEEYIYEQNLILYSVTRTFFIMKIRDRF